MKSPLQLAFALGLFLLSGAVVADSALEARVARLERILSSERPSELLLQVQRLQQEVQDLRGLVEDQQYTLDRLKQQQRDQYLDIDARLGESPDKSERSLLQTPSEAPYNDRLAGSGLSSQRRVPVTQTHESSTRVVPSLPSPETTAGGEREAYQAAFDQLKDRHYEEAIGAFTELLSSYPQGQYTPDALFWLGETYYVTRDYDAAIMQYDRLIAGYPASARIPSAMLKVGYIHDAQGREDDARAVLEEISRRYPNSTEARLANDRLGRLGRSVR